MSGAAFSHEVVSARAPKPKAGSSALRISQPTDSFEREADRVAEEVTAGNGLGPAWSLSRMTISPPSQPECSCGGECESCKARKMVQRKATPGPSLDMAAPAVNDVLRGPGRQLDRSTRCFMESSFGYDFGRVRIFDDHAAARSAEAVAANAYTIGENIVFNRGNYSPDSLSGRRLLAHELTHVVQQTAPVGAAETANVETDRKADQAEHHAGRIRRAPLVQGGAPIALARAIPLAEPKKATPLTPSELLERILNNRAFGAAAPTPTRPGENEQIEIEPKLRGEPLGKGYETFAAAQILSADGEQQIAYAESQATSSSHAEELVIARLTERLRRGGSVLGGKIMIAIDQTACGPGNHNCLQQLRDFATKNGLGLEIVYPEASGPRQVTPKTAARNFARRYERDPGEGELPSRVNPRIGESKEAPRFRVAEENPRVRVEVEIPPSQRLRLYGGELRTLGEIQEMEEQGAIEAMEEQGAPTPSPKRGARAASPSSTQSRAAAGSGGSKTSAPVQESRASETLPAPTQARASAKPSTISPAAEQMPATPETSNPPESAATPEPASGAAQAKPSAGTDVGPASGLKTVEPQTGSVSPDVEAPGTASGPGAGGALREAGGQFALGVAIFALNYMLQQKLSESVAEDFKRSVQLRLDEEKTKIAEIHLKNPDKKLYARITKTQSETVLYADVGDEAALGHRPIGVVPFLSLDSLEIVTEFRAAEHAHRQIGPLLDKSYTTFDTFSFSEEVSADPAEIEKLKRAKHIRENIEALRKLNEQKQKAAPRRAKPSSAATPAPLGPEPQQQSPGAPTPAPIVNFLPGASGENINDQAKRASVALASEGRGLQDKGAAMLNEGSPNHDKLEEWSDAEKTWRASAELIRDSLLKDGHESASQLISDVLNSVGAKLAETRTSFGI